MVSRFPAGWGLIQIRLKFCHSPPCRRCDHEVIDPAFQSDGIFCAPAPHGDWSRPFTLVSQAVRRPESLTIARTDPMLHSLNAVVEQWVTQWGYLGIFAAMVLENLIPPIPSEVIMPLAGFYVGQGKLNFVGAVLAGLLGTVVGALPWYGIGRLVNEERLKQWVARNGRWVGVSVKELDDSRHWFGRHGAAVVFWGRLLPAIRTLISVPAGIELMPFGPFLFWTTAGSLVWNLALTAAGWALGSNWTQVLGFIKPFEGIVNKLLALLILGVVVWLGLRVWKRARDSH